MLTPTTTLEAVNQMLGTISEAPVNTLVGTTSVDALTAQAVLNEISRDVQVSGWPFNTEVGYPLVPDERGEIMLPANCLFADSFGSDAGLDLVQRGGRLYDRASHTYTIGRTVTAEIVLLLTFEELPEAARRYIAVRSCRVFQKRVTGSQTLDAFTAEDETLARMAFRRAMGRSSDPNLVDAPDLRRRPNRR